MQIESLGFVLAVTLGLTFAISSVNKFRDLRGFALGVLEYDVLPHGLAITYARLVPFAEFGVGIALLTGVAPVASGLISAALLASFLVAVSINVARGRSLDCHCFGSQGGERIGWPTQVRLILLLAFAAVVVRTDANDLVPSESLPAVLFSLGILLGLYLLGGVPAVLRAWGTRGAPAPSVHGGRVSFRTLPLMPLSMALRDRTRESSRCGACP